MKAIKHKVNLTYQPTNTTCGYASLSMLLDFYGVKKEVIDLTKEVPQPVDEKGESFGSITAQLVQWCQQNGLSAHMYSFDPMITDLSWSKLSQQKILERLKAVKNNRVAPMIGEYWSKVYVQAYIDMMKAGAKLSVLPTVKSALLYDLLESGPVFVNVCSSVLRGAGRSVNSALRKGESDDVAGSIWNHSIIVYGNDEKGNFLVADPWSGMIKVEPEVMLCSITAAIVECDSQLFVIENSQA